MEEKKAWEEEQAELKRARDEAAAEAGEDEEVPPFEPEERDWTLFEYAPF